MGPQIVIFWKRRSVLKTTIAIAMGLFLGIPMAHAQKLRLTPNPFDRFENAVRPLLEKYCGDCHAPESREAEFLTPQTAVAAAQQRNSFASVAHHINDGTMPPEDSDQPSASERKVILDWIETTFTLTPADNDRISQYVVEIMEDKSGNLWFGTVTDGAARFDGKNLTWFNRSNGLAGDTVVSVVEDQVGQIWLGTDGGISRYDGKTFTHYSDSAGLPGTRCYLLLDRNGKLWAGTEKGVFRFDGTKFASFPLPDPENNPQAYKMTRGKVWCLTEDSKGNIWFGRDGLGACRFDGQNFTHFTKQDGLCSNNVSCIVEDPAGDIWFGCLSSDVPEYVNEGGLARFDGKTIQSFKEHKGLYDTDIYTIYATKAGEVWIGATGIGAYRFDGKAFQLFNKTDREYWTRFFGLQSMLEDRSGAMWFGFSGGLFRFNGNSFYNIGKNGPWGR